MLPKEILLDPGQQPCRDDDFTIKEELMSPILLESPATKNLHRSTPRTPIDTPLAAIPLRRQAADFLRALAHHARNTAESLVLFLLLR
jgi:hypothetical protein